MPRFDSRASAPAAALAVPTDGTTPPERRAPPDAPAAVGRDTARPADLAERRALDQRVADVVEQMSDAFIAVDAGWRVTYANREAARLNGTSPAALVGGDHWALWPETLGSAVERHYRRAARERVPVAFEHHYPGADVWHEVRAYPADDGGLAIFYRDISAQRQRDAERERLLLVERETRAEAERERVAAVRAREEAEAANAAKAQFLATVSHELRTPLTAIGGYAQLLELGVFGEVSSEQAEVLDRIQRSQQHLLGLLNAVLRYAKLEAGRVQFDIADVALSDVFRTVVALVEPQARGKGLTLGVAAQDPSLVVRADAEKVRQILVNLLSNAVKFTRGGGAITLSAAAGADAVAIRVADTGRGIPPEQRDRVFEPFVQVGRRPSSSDEGVGLGLAISRELARGMGGEITVESEPGVGSTFTLVLKSGTA
jgi:PAS domain S-box-containing protein